MKKYYHIPRIEIFDCSDVIATSVGSTYQDMWIAWDHNDPNLELFR